MFNILLYLGFINLETKIIAMEISIKTEKPNRNSCVICMLPTLPVNKSLKSSWWCKPNTSQ